MNMKDWSYCKEDCLSTVTYLLEELACYSDCPFSNRCHFSAEIFPETTITL